MLGALLMAALAAGAPARSFGDDRGVDRGVARMPGFEAVLLAHLKHGIGTEVLPTGPGAAIQPGMFVTIGLDGVQAYDRDLVRLQNGRVLDEVGADECARLCPASLFDAFQAEWLAAAIEGTQRSVEIPIHVLFAAHGQLPAFTLLDVIYAAATSRPTRPPELSLVTSSPGSGLRETRFFVLPPRGLELGQGSAALGLTVQFSRGRYRVRAEDSSFAGAGRVQNLTMLRARLREVKKRFPNKQTVILIPEEGVTVSDLVETISAVRADFPRIVLSAGQDVVLP